MKNSRQPPHDLDTIIPILLGIWRRFHKKPGPADVLQTREFRSVVSALKELKALFEKEKSGPLPDYFSNPDLLGAYILYQWVVHYQEGLSLLNEIPSSSNRVLDICSGPTPFAFAALRHGARDVYAIDQNEQALHLGAEICGRYGFPLTVRTWKGPYNPIPIEGTFDLIILGHCLSELFSTSKGYHIEKQDAFIDRLLHRLTPNGFLVIVDNSYNEANKRLLRLRDDLVKKGISIQAPCVWKGACPALQSPNSPCYAQREFEKPFLIREFQRATDIHLSSLKMSYLILRSPQAAWPVLPEKPLYRVISPPIDTYQGKRYFLCGSNGKKDLGSPLKSIPKEARAFDYLRRGELISVHNSLDRQQHLDITEGTTVTVEAACGKPLPHGENGAENI
jgi:SAM-dependent methyltransferase